jgi:chloramphenicol 3-O phosphotransferase
MITDMQSQVIVLNGGSSAGKSSLARALQEMLPVTWVTLSADLLIDGLPGHGEGPGSAIVFEPDGTITFTSEYRDLEDAWYAGLAAMARNGARLILDEVLLSGGAGQRRLSKIFDRLDVLWIGVHCDPTVAADREADRSGRVPGMALAQALAVHVGVTYDVEVDTTNRSAAACAASIAERILR